MQDTENYLKTLISFSEIVKGDNSSVRVTEDNLIHAIDLAMVVMGKGRDYAGQVLRNIPDTVFDPEWFINKRTKIHGSGGNRTKLLTLDGAIKLVMILPGKIARETRNQFARIIRRYFGGDEALSNEITANSISSCPLARMARETVHTQDYTRDENCIDSDIEKKSSSDSHQRQHKKRKAAEHMEFEDFIKVAFDYQKEALELRYVNELQKIKDLDSTEQIDEDIELSSRSLLEENEILKRRNKDSKEHIEDLKIELGISTSQLKKSNEELNDLMERLRILSHTEQYFKSD
jgi:hypothetical protein